jgi:RNA polymerase sigma factor (sigma-70 family)
MFKEALATAFAAAKAKNLSRAEADDVASRAVTKLFEQDPFPDNPDAWVTTAAQRMAIDRKRAQKRERRRGLGDAVDGEDLDGKAALAQFIRLGSPASQKVDDDAVQRIWLALEKALTLREFEIMQLTIDGAPQGEIAERLGYKNANTVKSTLVRIRRKIDEEFEQFRLEQGHPRVY